MGFFEFFFYSACVAIAIGNQLSFMFRSSMNYVDHKLSRKNVFVMSSFFGIMMSVAIYYFLFIFYYHNLGYHDKFLDMPVGLVLTMFCSGIFFVMKNIFNHYMDKEESFNLYSSLNIIILMLILHYVFTSLSLFFGKNFFGGHKPEGRAGFAAMAQALSSISIFIFSINYFFGSTKFKRLLMLFIVNSCLSYFAIFNLEQATKPLTSEEEKADHEKERIRNEEQLEYIHGKAYMDGFREKERRDKELESKRIKNEDVLEFLNDKSSREGLQEKNNRSK